MGILEQAGKVEYGQISKEEQRNIAKAITASFERQHLEVTINLMAQKSVEARKQFVDRQEALRYSMEESKKALDQLEAELLVEAIAKEGTTSKSDAKSVA